MKRQEDNLQEVLREVISATPVPSVTLGDVFARLAAMEAVIGLLIEVSFIATFTQRFFER